MTSKDAFIYSIYRKTEVLKLLDVYFHNFPLKSRKASKINLIKDFYLLIKHRNLNINDRSARAALDKFNQ